MNIKIPEFLHFKKKYGLLIADNEVSMVSWRKGNLERIGLFSNDDAGIARFLDFLSKNVNMFKDREFFLMVNIIGEDYRFEKVAHLYGKYKTDFHTKRMQQLFRGSQFFMSQVQGREERGRREDWVLFSGVLTETKILPWVNVVRRGGRYLAGVYMVSQLLSDTILNAIGGNTKGNNLLMTIHERGLLRQTFYVNGHLRFSRVSKINDESVDHVGVSIKKELERTLQYLASLKISIGGGMTVRMISPSNMVSQLKEAIASGERIKFEFQDVAQVAHKVGLKTPIESMGKDSSLPMHMMFSSIHMSQLAPAKWVSYYWAQLTAKLAVIVFIGYGVYAYATPLSYLADGYGTSSVSQNLQVKADDLKRQYDAEVGGVIGEPPSSPQSMKAVSDFYNVLEDVVVSPTQLLYFLGQGLRQNSNIQIRKVDWQISNSPEITDNVDTALINGNDVYQIMQVEGDISQGRSGETYRDVAERADKLIASFGGREDIHVEVIKVPSRTISTSNLSGSLSSDLDVEAPSSRDFVLQIIWKAYDKNGFAKTINDF